MKFDELFALHQSTWDEAYLGVSPLVPHKKAPAPVSIYQLLKKHPEVRLTVHPGTETESLKVLEGSLFPAPLGQAPAYLTARFDRTLTYSGYMFSPEIKAELPGLIAAFLSDFEEPVVFANSKFPTWKNWVKVAHGVEDLLVVVMDKKNFRYILGVVGE